MAEACELTILDLLAGVGCPAPTDLVMITGAGTGVTTTYTWNQLQACISSFSITTVIVPDNTPDASQINTVQVDSLGNQWFCDSYGDLTKIEKQIVAETDPVFMASAAQTISLTDIANWNNAYSSIYTNEMAQDTIAGMLLYGTGLKGTYNDGANTYTISVDTGYVIPTTTEQSNWNTAYGWGNHALAGYSKGSGVVDRVAFWTAVDTIGSDSLFNWDNTNKLLGIGSAVVSLNRATINGTTTGTGAYTLVLRDSAGTSRNSFRDDGNWVQNIATGFTGTNWDNQIAGTSVLKFSGGVLSPLLTMTASAGLNNAKFLFTGQGSGTDLTVGASGASSFPNAAYLITSSSRLNISGGATGSGDILFAPTSTLTFSTAKNWRTSNSRVFFIPEENTGNAQARVTFGPTLFSSTGTTESFFTWNGAINGVAGSTVALVGIRSSLTLNPNAATPLIIGFQHTNTLVASANNQILYGAHFSNTFTPGAFTGLLMAQVKMGAGSSTVAQFEWTSGTLLGTPRAGVMEFVTDKWYGTITTGASRKEFIMGDNAITDAVNLVFGTTTGTKIGTSTTQKIGFWNAAPIVQPTTAIGSATLVSPGAGSNIKSDDTFDGYTLQQIAKALRDTGLLA